MTYFRSLRDSQFGTESLITPFRQLKTTETTRLVGSTFVGTTIDPNFWVSAVAAAGANTQTGGQVTSTTGTTANGSASLTSVRVARYYSTAGNFYRGVHRLPDAGTANNVRRWGAFDDNDGAFFQLSGTTFSIVTRKATVDTTVSSGSFNGPTGTTFTPGTNVRAYEIHWNNSTVWFYADNVLIHTASFPTTTWASTPSLKCRVQNVNSGGSTTNVSIETRTMAIARNGVAFTRPQYYNLANVNETRVLKYGPGTLHSIFVGDPAITGTITLYDNTAGSGSIISTLNTADINVVNALQFGQSGIDFYNGLTYVSASNPGNVTFIYE
jgi:uncharacterized Zn-binding protein involved in type VI secretion